MEKIKLYEEFKLIEKTEAEVNGAWKGNKSGVYKRKGIWNIKSIQDILANNRNRMTDIRFVKSIKPFMV